MKSDKITSYCILIMGVSGSGKSSVGSLLADRLKLTFIEADDYHSSSNVQKMQSGTPLTDEDRYEWLQTLGAVMHRVTDGCVLACSALKASYRDILQDYLTEPLVIIYLQGSFDLIRRRIEARSNHFMPVNLLASQFETLEHPAQAFIMDVSQPIQVIVDNIINHLEDQEHESSIIENMNLSDIGVFGLGVMGTSLARNLASKGHHVAIYNAPLPGEEDKAQVIAASYPELNFVSTSDLQEFIQKLEKPRRILFMIQAGEPVDAMIEACLPFLDQGDMIIDAGNSFYKDTERRSKHLELHGLNYVGMGVSGGEEGALNGPSIMPAGSVQAKDNLMPILRSIAAKVEEEPCVQWLGPGGAGHFVKMVHNGIEYADMQLIAETFSICSQLLKMDYNAIADLFESWGDGLHRSYLLDITVDILRKKENGVFVLDTILDVAGHKGTGMWTSREALELGVAVPTITAAMNQRILSAYKSIRTDLGHKKQELTVDTSLSKLLKEAFLAARLIAHAEGFHLMKVASEKYGWNLDLHAVASLWRGGCIIRSAILPLIMGAFTQKAIPHLLYDPTIQSLVNKSFDSWARLIAEVSKSRLPIPCYSASYQYCATMFSAELSIPIIQAQRDYFGAHTFQTKDTPHTVKHVLWKE